MSLKRFSYVRYAGDTQSPSLWVTLVGPNGNREKTLALVDTGSEWSGMSAALALKLGVPAELHPAEGQAFGGLHPLEWWEDGPAVEFMGYSIVLSPLVGEKVPIVALGRNDFLRHFLLTVDQANEEFVLEASEELIAGHT
jgi:hypothetical protein